MKKLFRIPGQAGHQLTYEAPDPERLPKAVTEAWQRFTDLCAQAREADQHRYDLAQSKESVEQADAQKAADAVRSGKKAPGQPLLKKWQQDMQEADHRSKALHIAVADEYKAYVQTFESYRRETEDLAAAETQSAEEEYRKAVAAVRSAVARLELAYDQRAYVKGFPNKPNYSAGSVMAGSHTSLNSLNGSGHRLSDVLSALEEVAA